MRERALAPAEVMQALRASGVEVIREAANGNEIQCRCPYHEDRTGHLYVNTRTGAAFCQKCRKAVDIATLRVEVLPLSREDKLADTILQATATYYHERLSEHARTYLAEERAIPKQIVEHFQVGWSDGGLRDHLLKAKGFPQEACVTAGVLKGTKKGLRDFFFGRLIFPNSYHGQVVHLSGRRIDGGNPKWLHLPGEVTHPFNAAALQQDNCVWVEGILDVLSVETWGYPAAAGLGTHFKERWRSFVPKGHRVHVCLDGDPAGEDASLGVAAALGARTRIVTLPRGTDPNDLLRDNLRAEFESCLERSQDALTFQINRVPADTPKTDLPQSLEDVLRTLASIEQPACEAYLRVIKERFDLHSEEYRAYRRMVTGYRRQQEGGEDRDGSGTTDTTYSAIFDGLVDLVEHEGAPAFLVDDDGELTLTTAVERESRMFAPPPAEGIPWLLPGAAEVMRWRDGDTDLGLYDDLVSYYRSASELPSDAHYELLAAWTMHTYLHEHCQYSPVVCLYAVPERGKTRTAKAMVHVAYRGIHVESLREAYIVRFATHFRGTVVFDDMRLWRKAEREGSEDVLLGRFERGIKVPRVNHPDRGPHQDTDYYAVFGPTVIATNEQPHRILETRALTITMPQSRRTFETDVTAEGGRSLRERLVAFRARHMGEKLPDLPKPARGRLGDITKPLLQIVRLACPDREQAMRGLIDQFHKERLSEKADSLDSELLRALDGLRDEVAGGILPVRSITASINNSRPERDQLTPQRVGRLLRSLDFDSGPRRSAGATIQWNEETLTRAMEAYGLGGTAQTAHSTPKDAPAAVDSAECVESAESGRSAHPEHAGGFPAQVDTAPRPEQPCRVGEERLPITTVDGEVPEAEALGQQREPAAATFLTRTVERLDMLMSRWYHRVRR